VPLVAFDKNRNRLGRGKGYYDRYLTDKDSFNIALAYSCQELEEIPINKNDVKMSMILTEKDTY
jgi:5-formyltetrahydrofolate cyclo-ligase